MVGVVKVSKVMVVGSTLSDVLEVAKKPSVQQMKEEAKEEAAKEAWSEQKLHKSIPATYYTLQLSYYYHIIIYRIVYRSGLMVCVKDARQYI